MLEAGRLPRERKRFSLFDQVSPVLQALGSDRLPLNLDNIGLPELHSEATSEKIKTDAIQVAQFLVFLMTGDKHSPFAPQNDILEFL